MKIAVVGTGYVGLVSGACFAEMGLDITCVDVDRKKIDALNNGLIPIYEPGLEELVKRNVEEGRLHFTTELTDCLDKVEVVFSAVGTPPDEDGSADLKYVLEVARTFGRNIKKYTVLVTKSTVPVGTAQKVKAVIREEIDKRGCKIPFDVASNPEFLKEGAAIKDFMSPDRVVVGVESERARKLMTRLYRPFLINNFRVLFMDIPSAEMTKYAANAMLATRISFMNEIANLCDLVGANVEMVRKGIGSDARIGSKFPRLRLRRLMLPQGRKGPGPNGPGKRLYDAGHRGGGTGQRRAEIHPVRQTATGTGQPARKNHSDMGPRVQARNGRHARSTGTGGDRPVA